LAPARPHEKLGGIVAKQNVLILPITVSILVVLAIACQQACSTVESVEDEAGIVAASSEAVPTLDELKNATYLGFEGAEGPVALVDGSWVGAPFDEGSAMRPEVHFLGDFRLDGDLDGDKGDETVVLLSEDSGGSGTYLYLAVIGRKSGRLENVSTEFVGDRVQVRGARINEEKILLDVLRVGPADAACCPGELATLAWTLSSEGGLKEVALSTELERFSLETIGGTEWVLRAWAPDEPAPAEPEVTLTYKEGRFSGKSGCNNYFAAAEPGEMPGDVSVGPAGATRMACPEPLMEVESRFMQQLGAVRRIGFMATQLALSYEKDGVRGVMLFDTGESITPKMP